MLHNGRGFSALEGDGSNGLLVVAESLGRKEERAGLPLRPDAPSGGVFQKALDVGKLSRSQLTITNTIRCKAEAPYPREALDQCRQYLDQAVEERQPKLILALGDVPLRELSLVGGSISELRGYILPSRYGVPLLATYHPSYLARGAYGVLFGAFLHDIKRAYQFASKGIPLKLETNYVTEPSSTDISDYLERLRADSGLPAAHDIETEDILGIKGPPRWEDKKIIQVQFSSRVGKALVLSWPRHQEAIKAIYATPNPKWGWNCRLSDIPALRGAGVVLNGELHDLMNAWLHLQPNFASGKDASDSEDKGVPAKLASLQSCVSFYYPQEGPWKEMVEKAVSEASTRLLWLCQQEDRKPSGEELLAYLYGDASVQETLRWYGARDADMTFRVGLKIFSSLKKLRLW